MKSIIIKNAHEGNLKNISLEIPREQLICVTGVSGSGKSTLVMDTLFPECQRQYAETMGYYAIQKPAVESILNVSPAVQITQHHANKNPRSTVGTVTNIHADLRMIFEKVGVRTCPSCQRSFQQVDALESTEKVNGEFLAYVTCTHCEEKLEKITSSHFTYNTHVGACTCCSGLGELMTINWTEVVDESKSMEQLAITFFDKGYHDYVHGIMYKGFKHYKLPDVKNVAIADWTHEQKELLYKGAEAANINPELGMPKNVTGGRFEGLEPILWRRLADKKGIDDKINQFFTAQPCPECHGEKLNAISRAVKVHDTRLPELTKYSLEQLLQWVVKINASFSDRNEKAVSLYVRNLQVKINRLITIGIGYLTLNRQMITLSGGEQQKIKLSATLDSSLTGVIYLLDEPTTGLHPKDTLSMIELLKNMRDTGNTVIVIEHDVDVMKAADLIIDIGPGAGIFGGELIGIGTLPEIMDQATSVTGQYLKNTQPIKRQVRKANDYIVLKGVTMHNLQNISVQIPRNCLTVLAGASGSGKSTLVFQVLANEKLDDFNQIITVRQSSISKTKRSNVATFADAFTHIRTIFGKLDTATERGFSSKHFSFNTAGGRCETCEGLGVVPGNSVFLDNVELVCHTCNGKRFKDEVLEVKLEGLSISDVLSLSVEESKGFFSFNKKLTAIFTLLQDVGLSYITLGQSLTTLSGGEGQRLKLAKELLTYKGGKTLYLIDEPTTGLHPIDIEHFIVLLQRMVDEGNTVVVVEHNEQLLQAADFIIELGPEGGDKGGTVIAVGTPNELNGNQASVIGPFL